MARTERQGQHIAYSPLVTFTHLRVLLHWVGNVARLSRCVTQLSRLFPSHTSKTWVFMASAFVPHSCGTFGSHAVLLPTGLWSYRRNIFLCLQASCLSSSSVSCSLREGIASQLLPQSPLSLLNTTCHLCQRSQHCSGCWVNAAKLKGAVRCPVPPENFFFC